MEAVLDHLTRQIHVGLPTDFSIVGIRRRGVPLADQLAERLGSLLGQKIPVAEVSLKRYADDLSLLHEEPRLDTDNSSEIRELHGKTVLLVDDVLFSGRTLLSALHWLRDAQPAAVRVAVLCARDTQEVPLTADFIGMQLDVGPNGKIDVDAPPYENEWSVWLSHPEDDAAAEDTA